MARNRPRSTIRYLLIATALLLLSVAAIAQDPITTNPGKYTMILDTARVRVLEYRDRAGEKTAIHSHPDSVIYALAPFKRKLTVNGGREVVVEMKAGDVRFLTAQTHVGENIGSDDTHVILFELKEPAPGAIAGQK